MKQFVRERIWRSEPYGIHMDLGIDLSVASLQQYALNQGITKSVSAMTQAEKVMLRYNYLLEVTGQQQGDFKQTADKLKSVA